MITFIIGLLILLVGYLTYSKYIEKQFSPEDRQMPCDNLYNGVDYVPLSTRKNEFINILNIAGMGPILSALQGIVFGPVFFIIVPLGCILMGCVHDYFSGMISVRHKGLQLTQITKEYFGSTFFNIFTIIVTIMSFFWCTVFIYAAGDLYLGKILHQTNFTLDNPAAIITYILIGTYFFIMALFPINKLMAKIYPYIGALVILGSVLLLIGYIINGISIPELDIHHLNWHPKGLPWIPFFFMTVSCGLLSGSHATQTAIVARTLKNEFEGRRVFFKTMCYESLIVMVWAAGAICVYNNGLVPSNMIGTVNVVDIIAKNFTPFNLSLIVVFAVLCLPLTSGDTCLRALRMVVADALNLDQKPLKNRLIIMIPSIIAIYFCLYYAKVYSSQFSTFWQYVMLFNQLLVIPTFLIATIYLYKRKKNYLLTLIPGMFYIFIISAFIFNAKIGFNLSLQISEILAIIVMVISLWAIMKKCKNYEGE
ncbi:carbon starvation protein A [bacterium]|nr:carbon starvation protein A [bacterium]